MKNIFNFVLLPIYLLILGPTKTNSGNDGATKDKFSCGKIVLDEMKIWEFYKVEVPDGNYRLLYFAQDARKSKEAVENKGILLLKAYVSLLSNADDNLVFHASPFASAEFQQQFPIDTCFAVKIVDFEELRENKPRELVEHELEMLQLAKLRGSTGVAELQQGFIFENAAFFMLELGETDLLKFMKHSNGQVLSNLPKLMEMVLAMAEVLEDLFKFAIHNGLKLANWLIMKHESRFKIKLIDLQTAVPLTNGVVENTWKTRKLLCKASEKRNFPRARRYASPELGAFCGSIMSKFYHPGKDSQLAAMLTPKSDIWSFGIVLCQLLSMTPKFKEKQFTHNANLKAFEPLANAFILGKDNQGLLEFVRSEFAPLFPVISACLSIRPENRPSATKIISNFKQFDGPHSIENAEKIWKNIF